MKGTSIKAWRKYRRMSQEALAAKIGMTAGNLSKLERGLIPYSQEGLEAAAEALGCEGADLLKPFAVPVEEGETERLLATYRLLTPKQRESIATTAALFAGQNQEAAPADRRRTASGN